MEIPYKMVVNNEINWFTTLGAISEVLNQRCYIRGAKTEVLNQRCYIRGCSSNFGILLVDNTQNP